MIVQILTHTPQSLATIAKAAGISTAEAAGTLLELELQGLVSQTTGNSYKLVAQPVALGKFESLCQEVWGEGDVEEYPSHLEFRGQVKVTLAKRSGVMSLQAGVTPWTSLIKTPEGLKVACESLGLGGSLDTYGKDKTSMTYACKGIHIAFSFYQKDGHPTPLLSVKVSDTFTESEVKRALALFAQMT